MRVRSWLGVLLVVFLALFAVTPALAASEPGTMVWGVHVTLASRWLDPAETEALITPFMVLYALHDALVKPMPGGHHARRAWPSRGRVARTALTYEFVLRKGVQVPQRRPGHRRGREVLLRALQGRGGQAPQGRR